MKRLLIAVALASICALSAASTAFAAGPGPVRVSHGDPFANCLLGGNAFGAKSFRSAEVEPWIADNPANTSNLIATWQQTRWSDGGAKGQVAAWTFDGGKTWGQTPQPFTRCAQPFYDTPVLQYERTSDPWVSFGPDGTAYALSLPFDGDFIRAGLGAAVSHDGGRTWVHQQDIHPLVARPDTFQPTTDKEAVTADPVHAGWAYAVWDDLNDIFPPCPAAAARAAVTAGRDSAGRKTVRAAATSAAAGPDPCPNLFTGPAMFSRTEDGGKSWSKARVIVPTPPNEQTIGNVIVINRQTDVLYDFFNYIDAAGRDWVDMIVSTDRGDTWTPHRHIQRLATTAELRACFCGVVHPLDPLNPKQRLRTGDIIPEAAIDPNNGQLYVVWQDGTPNAFRNDMLLASTSTDGGLTWSAGKLVNPPDDNAAFTGAVAVNNRGQVGVLYYDFTPPPTSKDLLLTSTWFVATSGPGLDFGARHLAGGPFNMEAAPFARGYFTGDYMGLAARVPALQDESGNQQGSTSDDEDGESHGRGFVSAFAMTNCKDNSCKAVGSPDGAPVGPDSTDVFSSRH